MANHRGVDVSMGGGTFGFGFTDPEKVAKALDILTAGGVRLIDTAQGYGESESVLGSADADKRGFIISTKDSSALGGRYNGKDVEDNAMKSLAKLRASQVDIFFLHGPDLVTPLSEYLPNVDNLYKKGVFRRFGISNYPPNLVEETYAFCKEHNLVLPTVYQGNY